MNHNKQHLESSSCIRTQPSNVEFYRKCGFTKAGNPFAKRVILPGGDDDVAVGEEESDGHHDRTKDKKKKKKKKQKKKRKISHERHRFLLWQNFVFLSSSSSSSSSSFLAYSPSGWEIDLGMQTQTPRSQSLY
mmetsp:Transcript_43539/g.72338  ORF Transcript_43539/g.72338 Transcript_43539/m.72338 type:complete len:133 (+) Transcript_43539:95-493(+)